MNDELDNKLSSAELELEILTNLFVNWWFKDWEDSHFFNEAVKQCPTLKEKATKHYK